MKYSIIDIETTGLSPSKEKVTEIAIINHNGSEVEEEFVSLINPEKKIPYRIIQMTGINNQMVETAPKFYEIAKKIVEMTEGRIVVGHNVRFDYNFLRHEFLSLGYDYERKTIDTVKLSRKLIPGRRSYGLGKLCKDLGINNHARHRASGDATVTAKLFELLLSIDDHPEELNLRGLQSDINKSLVEELPREAGVYYFYDNQEELIYVGKSINIHDRVLSHLNNNLHKKAVEMKTRIKNVKYNLTGNDLTAMLLESHEIKKHQPIYNRQQKRTYFNYGLYSFTDDNGYTNLKVIRIVDELPPLYTYSSLQEGKEHITMICQDFNLCQKLCGLYDTQGACFHYQIHSCNGACIGEEPAEHYNIRVHESIDNYQFKHQNFFILDEGRNESENSVIKVQNGKYCGFGYVFKENNDNELEALHSCIVPYHDNKEVRRFILNYLRKQEAKIVYY